MNDFDNSPRTGFDSTLVLVSYIVSLFTAVVGPLIIWALKKMMIRLRLMHSVTLQISVYRIRFTCLLHG